MWLVLFIIGFLILIKGADLLVDGSSSLAKRLKVSDLVIGLTIVSIGTSAPELFVNIISSLKDDSELVIGNILGSNIANILLILGISALIYPLMVKKSTIWKEIPFSLLAVIILAILANDILIINSNINLVSRIDGIVLLFFFLVFLYYSFSLAREKNGIEEHLEVKPRKYFVIAGMIILGLLMLIVGARWVVDGAVRIAYYFGVSQFFIGLTIVAIGTSLPELVTSVVAAYKRKADIAIGNIVGSNIFNIFLILGISSILNPIIITNPINLDIGVLALATLLFFIWMFVGKKHLLERWQGLIMFFSYIAYIIYLVYRG